MWATQHIPADNLDPTDGPHRPTATTLPNGVVFRILCYAPGTSGRMHRTNSVDYGVVLSGKIILQLEEGTEVSLEAGDVLVQRGTAHNWINRDAQPCTIAFVLIDALPISGN